MTGGMQNQCVCVKEYQSDYIFEDIEIYLSVYVCWLSRKLICQYNFMSLMYLLNFWKPNNLPLDGLAARMWPICGICVYDVEKHTLMISM